MLRSRTLQAKPESFEVFVAALHVKLLIQVLLDPCGYLFAAPHPTRFRRFLQRLVKNLSLGFIKQRRKPRVIVPLVSEPCQFIGQRPEMLDGLQLG